MIRTRLTFWNSTVLTFVLAALGAVLYLAVTTMRYESVDADLLGQIGLMQKLWTEVETGVNRRPPPPLSAPIDVGGNRALAKHIELEIRIGHPMLFSVRGRNLVQPQERPWDIEGLLGAGKGAHVLNSVAVEGLPIRVLSIPIYANHRIVAVAQVAAMLDTVDKDAEQLAKALLIMLPVAIIVTAFTGLLLTRHMMLPLRDLSEAAKRMESENPAGRLPVHGRDEFAELATNFNGMLVKLDDAFQRLDASLEAQRQFTADASHDLKSPLTTVKARVGIALLDDRTPQGVRQQLHAIDRATDRMTQIVRDLLFLAQSDEGRLTLSLSEVSLLNCLIEAIESIKALEERQVELRVPSNLTFYADRQMIGRVFANLLDNASRHTPVNGVVGVDVRRKRHLLSIRIYDNGEGIPADQIPHVFERMYRVDGARTTDEGRTGLGLAIVKSIVEAHGGSVSIDSRLGHGTSVCLILPREMQDS